MIGVVLCSVFLAGCADINIGQKSRNEPQPVMTRTDDVRSVEAIRADNAELRARQAELESTYQRWQAAVAQEERTKKDLKAQKDRAEKDLKDAQKRAKKS